MIERLLGNAALYEFVQTATGSRISEARMREILGPIEPGTRILDAGGGTGIIARVFDSGRSYCCMDLDLARVRVAHGRGASAVQGDVTQMPVRTASIDLVVLRAISHHLGDDGFAKMVAESRRIIKPGGRLLFLDAIWAPSWLPGRLMWRIDQGSHPRTEEHMGVVLENHFVIERRVAYSIYHRYFLATARPKTNVPMPSRPHEESTDEAVGRR
ncbi:MAG TPA: class I SAM-dependent methyltransferase [Candidatus Dormibacteraeota bacterium]|jgi:SAM-dependent methyltransferase|nr:class I SAM-dependent methyltransferase [Candidatus Dormibacteraeota bacterium]